MDVDRTIVARVVTWPDEVEQLRAREDLARVPRKQCQEVKLATL